MMYHASWIIMNSCVLAVTFVMAGMNIITFIMVWHKTILFNLTRLVTINRMLFRTSWLMLTRYKIITFEISS